MRKRQRVLVTRKQVRFLSRRLKQSVLIVGSRMKSGSEFHAIGPATENARRPAVSVQPETWYDKMGRDSWHTWGEGHRRHVVAAVRSSAQH